MLQAIRWGLVLSTRVQWPQMVVLVTKIRSAGWWCLHAKLCYSDLLRLHNDGGLHGLWRGFISLDLVVDFSSEIQSMVKGVTQMAGGAAAVVAHRM